MSPQIGTIHNLVIFGTCTWESMEIFDITIMGNYIIYYSKENNDEFSQIHTMMNLANLWFIHEYSCSKCIHCYFLLICALLCDHELNMKSLF
jgi:hypothetical protein